MLRYVPWNTRAGKKTPGLGFVGDFTTQLYGDDNEEPI